MPAQRHWIAAGLLVTGGLVLVAFAGLEYFHDSGWLTYHAPPGRSQDNLTLVVSGSNIELLDGATQAVLQSQPLAGTVGVNIQGVPGNVDDVLTVDLSGGALALPAGIHYDGGTGGYDTLVVTGGEAAPGSYLATGPGSGVIAHGGTRVYFSNLEPITDTAPAPNFTINGTAGNNTINIVDGGLACAGTCLTTKVSSPSFESVAFANKTNVTVSAGAGADALNLNNPHPAAGLSELVLDAGGNAGDVISLTNFNLPGGTLSLTNAITVTQSGVVTVANLAVHAAGPVTLGNPSNQVTTVAGNSTTPGAPFVFASSVPTLTVGTVEGIAGITTVNGPVQVEHANLSGMLAVNNAISTAGGSLTLFADHMAFNAALNAGTGVVYLDNESLSEPIDLGTKPANTLGLIQSDLNQITAGTLRIGDFASDTGGLTVTASIISPAGWSTLDLRQATNIAEGLSGLLTVPNLVLRTNGGNVNISNFGNHVSALAGATLGGTFGYRDVGHTTISTVGGVSGISSAGGTIGVVAHKGGLTVDKAVLAGAGLIVLTAEESAGPGDNVTVDPGVVVSSTAGIVELSAGDQVNLESGSLVASGNPNGVAILLGSEDTDGLGGGTIAGIVMGSRSSVFGDTEDDSLFIDFTAGASFPDELLYDGGLGQNSLTISDAGGSSPHLYVGNGTGLSRDFANLVHLDRVQIITVTGGSGPDNFDFGADAGAVFHVNGGLPGGAPGDTLFLNLLGATNPTLAITSFDATGATGSWTFGNRQPVFFTGIDTFGNLNVHVALPLILK